MAIPLAAAGVAASIPSLIKFGSGIRQVLAAKKAEKKLKRPSLEIPKYEIPGQVTDVTKKVKMGALDTKLPGGDIMKSEVDAETANAIQAARQAGASSADVLSTIASMGGQASKAKRQIDIAGIQRQDEMQSDVNRALMTEAAYEDKKQAADREKYMSEFQYNLDQPYQSEAATISALRQSGNQNIYGAASDLATLGTSLLMTNAMMPGSTGKMGAPNTTPPPRTITTGPIMGPPSYEQWMAQGKPAIGPPTFDQWAAQNPVATGTVPYNMAGFNAGRMSNTTVSPQPAAAPVVTRDQAMMGQYSQTRSPYNFITGVPAAALAGIKPSWYMQGRNPYYNYDYLSNPNAPSYSGVPYQSQAGPRQ